MSSGVSRSVLVIAGIGAYLYGSALGYVKLRDDTESFAYVVAARRAR